MMSRRKSKKSRCWRGYKPTPGKKPYSKGSCVKEAYARIANVLSERTKDKNNAWAICTAQVGRKDPEKYERCVKKVKTKMREALERVLHEKKGVMPKMKMGVHKSRAGGLTKKGVEAYRRANPGSKLKTAVTTKPSKLKKGSKAANRRKSFCSRMSGMKKRLTSKKTANDPDSRINKALRKWNC